MSGEGCGNAWVRGRGGVPGLLCAAAGIESSRSASEEVLFVRASVGCQPKGVAPRAGIRHIGARVEGQAPDPVDQGSGTAPFPGRSGGSSCSGGPFPGRGTGRGSGGGVGRTGGGPGGGAPEGASGAPGRVALFVDEFRGRADQVGDDGEEAGVDLLLGASAAVMRSDWVTGCRPRWFQVSVTGLGRDADLLVCSQRVVPSQVKRISSTTVSPSVARRRLAVLRPRGRRCSASGCRRVW